jgi:hypothetical protein
LLFDDRMRGLFAEAHPLLRVKFSSPDRLPFYHLYRARAVKLAASISSPATGRGPASPTAQRSEVRLESQDRQIAGRPDYIDAPASTVIDYKTTAGEPPEGLSDPEARQLRLYVYLALQNGIAIEHAAVVQADGKRRIINVSRADAFAEADRARAVLKAWQALSGRPFQEATSPSSTACRFCPCIAFCEAFWDAAADSWASQVGVHIEGIVTRIDGSDMMSIELEAVRGSCRTGPAPVTRISRDWLAFDGPAVAAGERIRIVDLSVGQGTELQFRADKVATAIWRIGNLG